MSEFIPEDLCVGEAVLEMRWRLQHHALPLKNRHVRALAASGVGAPLVSWARQHIEWTLAEGAMSNPDGVLVLKVDAEGRAVMEVVAFEPLPASDSAMLLARAAACQHNPAPAEVAWVVRNGSLVALMDDALVFSGANSLVEDLAHTLKLPVSREAMPQDLSGVAGHFFLVSDEFGVVAPTDATEQTRQMATRFAEYYARLVGLTLPDEYDRGNLGIHLSAKGFSA